MSSVYVIVDAFKAFLDEHGVFNDYVIEWRYDLSHEFDGRLLEWWGEHVCSEWLSSAFIWCMSKRGSDFWCDLNVEWIGICKENGWLKLLGEYE